MSDLKERQLERDAMAGDSAASAHLAAARCRRGKHEWRCGPVHAPPLAVKSVILVHARHCSRAKNCIHCGVSEAAHEQALATLRRSQARAAKKAKQRDLCARDIHDWVPGEDPSEECGCPADPGIHGCHPAYCSGCGEPEEL
ncbi:hypothetical protein LCGC14_0736350 [marine sediment metagenome]|uniref:Uncharacterized protein n=1 Tax=marine sediment metagenome TaxID=412755 RepID=A0A0F9QSX4_9ZZZZ